MLRMSVVLAPGRPIPYSDAMNRRINVWWRGLGTGFPLASLITMAVAHGRLTHNGATSWDTEGGFVVRHERIGVGRLVALVLFFFAVVLLAAIRRAA